MNIVRYTFMVMICYIKYTFKTIKENSLQLELISCNKNHRKNHPSGITKHTWNIKAFL